MRRSRVERPFTRNGKCSVKDADSDRNDRSQQSGGHVISHVNADIRAVTLAHHTGRCRINGSAHLRLGQAQFPVRVAFGIFVAGLLDATGSTRSRTCQGWDIFQKLDVVFPEIGWDQGYLGRPDDIILAKGWLDPRRRRLGRRDLPYQLQKVARRERTLWQPDKLPQRLSIEHSSQRRS
jgi:hypothetical protein